MIKRIELVNFMSHKHTVIEPAKGLTVLVGPNNCGKSAVMSALQILCHNDSSTYVTRHGEKECSIVVETDDGDVIQWSRIRASTKYVINGETFDRLRGNVPNVLFEVLKLPKVQLDQSKDEFDIHFGNQKDPVFLINESGRAAAGFFAASSDASRLLEMQKLHSQKVKEAGRDAKRLAEEAEQLSALIDQLEFVPELKNRFNECNQLIKSMDIHENAISVLESIRSKMKHSNESIDSLSMENRVLQRLAPPPQTHSTQPLSSLIARIQNFESKIEKLESMMNAFQSLCSPPTLSATNRLATLIGKLESEFKASSFAKSKVAILDKVFPPPKLEDNEPIQILVETIKSWKDSIKEHQAEQSELDRAVAELEYELEQFVAKNPNCPTCHQPLSKQHLSRHSKGETFGQ